MNDRGSEVWERQDFPPWSIKVLLLWLVGFLVLSGVVAIFFAYGVSYLNIYYELHLNPGEHYFSITMPSHIAYKGLIFLFIFLQLKKTSFSLENIWISYELHMRHVVIGLLVGTLLMSLQLLIHKANTGQATLPPLYPIRFDWHIALGTELLAFVIMAGLVEEILFRGVIYQALRKRFSLAISLLLSTTIFALFHIDLILNPYAITYVIFFGVIAAFLFEQTRSLNICISFHIAGNATEVLVRYLTHIISI